MIARYQYTRYPDGIEYFALGFKVAVALCALVYLLLRCPPARRRGDEASAMPTTDAEHDAKTVTFPQEVRKVG